MFRYGNWCGPNWTAKQNKPTKDLEISDLDVEAVDKLDEICKKHDIDLWIATDDIGVKQANFEFEEAMDELSDSLDWTDPSTYAMANAMKNLVHYKAPQTWQEVHDIPKYYGRLGQGTKRKQEQETIYNNEMELKKQKIIQERNKRIRDQLDYLTPDKKAKYEAILTKSDNKRKPKTINEPKKKLRTIEERIDEVDEDELQDYDDLSDYNDKENDYDSELSDQQYLNDVEWIEDIIEKNKKLKEQGKLYDPWSEQHEYYEETKEQDNDEDPPDLVAELENMSDVEFIENVLLGDTIYDWSDNPWTGGKLKLKNNKRKRRDTLQFTENSTSMVNPKRKYF